MKDSRLGWREKDLSRTQDTKVSPHLSWSRRRVTLVGSSSPFLTLKEKTKESEFLFLVPLE